MSPATVAAQSGANENFYCTVYYITLNSNCEAQRTSKNVEDRELQAKNNA